jgi:hypothetical protein
MSGSAPPPLEQPAASRSEQIHFLLVVTARPEAVSTAPTGRADGRHIPRMRSESVPASTAAGELRGIGAILRGICGAVTTESPQTWAKRPTPIPVFSGVSPVFAGLRGIWRNRGAEIRTRDLTDPNGARYQAAPRPDAQPVFHTRDARRRAVPARARATADSRSSHASRNP